MPKLSDKSKAALDTCLPSLQNLFKELISYVDFTVIEGHRGQEAQDKAYAEGNSKLMFPNGKHNNLPSHAVDVIAYPIDWNNVQRNTYFAGIVMGFAMARGIKLRWGGDFNENLNPSDEKFKDLVHFEVK